MTSPRSGVVISYAFVDGFTRVACPDAIERLKQAVADAGGVIIDFALFGRDAMRLTTEVDAGAIGALQRDLQQAEVELFPRCLVELEDAKSMSATHRILAMVHVAFVPPELEGLPA